MSATPRWVPPDDVRLAGERASARYVPATIILDGEAPQKSITPATEALYRALLAKYPGLTGQGLARASDRRHTTGQRRDMHEEGRGFDLGIPSGPNRSPYGSWVAGELILDAEALGIQALIWQGTEMYTSNIGPRWEDYNGTSDHADHIHVELSPDTANLSPEEIRDRLARAPSMRGGGGGVSGATVAGLVIGGTILGAVLRALSRRKR